MRAAGGVRGPINETLHLRAAIQNVAHVPSPAPSEYLFSPFIFPIRFLYFLLLYFYYIFANTQT